MPRNARFTANAAHKESEGSPPSFQLSNDEVHVWCASLEQPYQALTRFSALLSPDENTRAGRFHFERDRNRYIVGRGLLRTMLGRYLAIEPSQIEFHYGRYGKPFLQTAFHNNILQFNLSHSNSLAVFVFRWNRQVGIDVEFIHSISNEDAFAEQLFSARESALIHALSGQEKLDAFFKLWTCKEAFFKASGDGLTKSLAEVEIFLGSEETARLVSDDGDQNGAAGWQMELFKPAAGYQACLAVEGKSSSTIFRQVNDFLMW